mmetsp:Transcript_45397/g.119939  ORF Transcript_45397/g.119939 Transcript_45397/m.119939 type:complete len:466 (-) Transcript_45397:82-1479(-)
MGASMDCCVRRGEGSSCCDLNDSILGEDAFYRDAFYDCEEGTVGDDWLFEQARLKMRKSTVLARFASFELSRLKGQSTATVKNALSQCVTEKKLLDRKMPELCRKDSTNNLDGLCRAMSNPTIQAHGSWLGSTIPQWTNKELPETGDGPYWSRGDGSGLRVRSGPDYRRTGQKCDSNAAMYGAVCCDAIKANAKVENIIGRHIDPQRLPSMNSAASGGDCSGGNSLQWSSGCPLPRIICINLMMPYEAGILPFRKDGGCSFVGVFEIKPETIKACMGKDMPPHIRLFKDFFEGSAGVPGGSRSDPNRCLVARVDKKKKKDQQSGLFKAVAKCVNPGDVSVPECFNTYNGKPCLITKCGYVIKDPAGEWLEIGIDVRGFNVLARKMLVSCRNMLPRTKIHYGFMIQGVEDEELPEALLCDMYVHGIDMMANPWTVDDDVPLMPSAKMDKLLTAPGDSESVEGACGK